MIICKISETFEIEDNKKFGHLRCFVSLQQKFAKANILLFLQECSSMW